MVYHYIVGLHVAVHDTIGVSIVQGTQEFIDVIADVVVAQRRVQNLKVCVLDVLKDKRWSLYI